MSKPVRSRRVRGFTLIELLVVVAIIALLISILLPSLSRARAVARITKCMANQKQYSNANQMYADTYSELYVPILWRWGGYWDRVEWMENPHYRSFLGIIATTHTTFVHEVRTTLGEGLLCPDVPPERRSNNGHSYAFQWYVGPNSTMEGRPISTIWASIGPHIRRSKVVQPAMKFQMIDASDWHVPNVTKGDYVINWDVHGENMPNTGMVTYRHLEGANLTFFDGHGEYMSKFDVYKNDAQARYNLWAIYE